MLALWVNAGRRKDVTAHSLKNVFDTKRARDQIFVNVLRAHSCD